MDLQSFRKRPIVRHQIVSGFRFEKLNRSIKAAYDFAIDLCASKPVWDQAESEVCLGF